MTVPIVRSAYTSPDSDGAWQTIEQMYMNVHPRSATTDVAFAADSAATMDLAVDHARLTADIDVSSEGTEHLVLIHWLGGHMDMDFGRYGATVNTGGDSCLYVPRSPATFVTDGFDAVSVRMSMDVVDDYAVQALGMAQGALRFTSIRPLTADHGRMWGKVALLLHRQLSAAATSASEALVYRQLLNLVAATAVTSFPNTALSRGYVPGPGDVRPAAVRRAVAYIDAHASLPITVGDIAAAAGTTARDLQAAFGRHLDTTPTAYLHRARLQAAERDLEDLDPGGGTTVAAVAARWGFSTLHAFEVAYQAAHGTTHDLAAPADGLQQQDGRE